MLSVSGTQVPPTLLLHSLSPKSTSGPSMAAPVLHLHCSPQERKNRGREVTLPFKDTSWKLHIPFLLPFPRPELANMATPHCKGIWEMQSLFWVAMCWVLIEKEERMPVGGPQSLSQKPVRLRSQSKHWACDNTARVMETRAAGLVQSQGKKRWVPS